MSDDKTRVPDGPSWASGAYDDELIYRAMKAALRVLAPHGDPDDDAEIVGPRWERLLTTGLAAAVARGGFNPDRMCEQLNEALASAG